MQPKKPAAVSPSLETQAHEWSARILRGAPALLSYIDTSQRFLYVNEAHRNWLGVDPAQMIGRNLIEFGGRRNYLNIGPALERAFTGHVASCEGEAFEDALHRERELAR